MRTRNLLIVFLAMAGIVISFSVVPSGAQDNGDSNLPTWQHAAKFICGFSPSTEDDGEAPVLQGTYSTAINVHNPNSQTVRGNASIPGGPNTSGSFSPTFRKKVVVLFATLFEPKEPETPQPPSPWFRPAELRPDWGFEIDCDDIRDVLLEEDIRAGAELIKGFVVIEARGRLPLDVVAAYTTLGQPVSGEFAGGGRQNTLEIETVQPKKIRSG